MAQIVSAFLLPSPSFAIQPIQIGTSINGRNSIRTSALGIPKAKGMRYKYGGMVTTWSSYRSGNGNGKKDMRSRNGWVMHISPPYPSDSSDPSESQPKSEPKSQSQSQSQSQDTTTNPAAYQLDDGSLSPSSSDLPSSPTSILPPRLYLKQPLLKVPTTWTNLVTLLGLFLTWYYTNTVFNVYNKQILKVFPYAWTCTTVQFFVAAVVMSSMWVLRVRPRPVVDKELVMTVSGLGVLHAAGFLLTNMSLGSVSVAFTHTVKATEPFFSVALSPSILGEVPTWGILGSLFPIVAGVAIASATEASFTWFGFLTAMGSNLALQSRNVLSKKLLKRGSETVDNINLFSLMTIAAFLFMVPMTFAVEGWKLTVPMVQASGWTVHELAYQLVMSGICRCGDVLASYMILNRVSPVSHSVGNCVKRAVVIIMSVVVFKTPMSFLNILGTAMALTGVMVYSLIVVGCKQNKFGPENPMCKPIYELKLEDGAGI